jgi:hypothetical protein
VTQLQRHEVRFWGVTLGVILVLLVVRYAIGTNAGLGPDAKWDRNAVWSSPLWLQVWLLGPVSLVFYAAFVFAFWYQEARWAAAAFVVSHVPVFASEGMGLTVGMVGVIHLICWAPALYVAARRLRNVEGRTPFGIWVHAFCFVVSVSLVFDARDGFAWLLR